MTLCLFPQGCDFQGLKMSGTDFSKASGVGATFSFATLLGFQESEKQGRDVAEMQPRCGTDAAQMRHRCGTDARVQPTQRPVSHATHTRSSPGPPGSGPTTRACREVVLA